MIDKPKRRYELKLTAGADDLPYLINMLQEQLSWLQKWPDNQPYDSFSGGYSGYHSCVLKIDLEQDHDKYFEAFDAYIKGGNHGDNTTELK